MSVPAESDVFRTLTQKASEAIGPRNACLGVAQGMNDGRAIILQRSSWCGALCYYCCWRSEEVGSLEG